MQVKIHLAANTPSLQQMMDKADLSDGGTKAYVDIYDLEITYKEESGFIQCIKTVCFGQQEKLGVPVLIYATSDKGQRLLYLKEGVISLSDGHKWWTIWDHACLFVKVELDEGGQKIVDVEDDEAMERMVDESGIIPGFYYVGKENLCCNNGTDLNQLGSFRIGYYSVLPLDKAQPNVSDKSTFVPPDVYFSAVEKARLKYNQTSEN